jgi:predicted HTH transcriptional regulator
MCQARVFHSQAQVKMHKFNTKTQNEPLHLSFKRLWKFIHKEITTQAWVVMTNKNKESEWEIFLPSCSCRICK